MSVGVGEHERVTEGAVKAIANFTPVAVLFGADAADERERRIVHLANPKVASSPLAIAKYRGAADAAALQFRYNDAAIHAKYRPDAAPLRALYEELTRSRALALGARQWRGVASNLHAWLEDPHGDGRRETDELTMIEALGLMLFAAVTQQPLSARLAAQVSPWQERLLARASTAFDDIVAAASEQERFAVACGALLQRIESLLPTTPASLKNRASGKIVPAPSAARHYLSRLTGALADLRNKAQPDADVDASESLAEQHRIQGAAGANAKRPDAKPTEPGHYHVYSTAFDQECRARDLANAAERAASWQQLNEELRPLRSMVSRLAMRLQRRLLAKQRWYWESGLSEGLLDASRMSRVVTHPLDHRAFKQPRDCDFKDTILTLLLDNSGSMRGAPIKTTAICADVLAEVMERCGIRVEILGFTTTHWNGGPLRERWLSDGQPPHPGRLNGVRHIIYKRADVLWRQSRQDIAIMLKADVLKENIDGEALLWAHRRLLARPEARKILLVLSDGSPRDEATLVANGSTYLEDHLHLVTKHIESQGKVHLIAIGIKHDVGRHYRHAMSIRHHEELGGAMLGELENLFVGHRP